MGTLRDAKWVNLLTALEKFQVAVDETVETLERAQAVPRPIAEAFREIRERVVMELRPFVLERLSEAEGARGAKANGRSGGPEADQRSPS